MTNLLKKLFSKNEVSHDEILETKELTHESLVKELGAFYRMYWTYTWGKKDPLLKNDKVVLKWKDYERGKLKKEGINRFHPKDPKDVFSGTDGSACSVRVDGMFAHIHFINVMYSPYKLPNAENKFQCTEKIIKKGNETDHLYNYIFSIHNSLDNGISWNEQSREELELKYTLIKKK